MSNSWEEQQKLNAEAFENPQIGDYWNEMFCPYFLVVDIDKNNDEFTVLSCSGGPKSYNRKNEPCAKIDNEINTWSFDLTKGMKVNHKWIRETVKYDTNDKFVAHVVRNNTFLKIAKDWSKTKERLSLKEALEQSNWNLV